MVKAEVGEPALSRQVCGDTVGAGRGNLSLVLAERGSGKETNFGQGNLWDMKSSLQME